MTSPVVLTVRTLPLVVVVADVERRFVNLRPELPAVPCVISSLLFGVVVPMPTLPPPDIYICGTVLAEPNADRANPVLYPKIEEIPVAPLLSYKLIAPFPAVAAPELTVISPLETNVLSGVVVPIPIFPPLVTVILLVLLVSKLRELASLVPKVRAEPSVLPLLHAEDAPTKQVDEAAREASTKMTSPFESTERTLFEAVVVAEEEVIPNLRPEIAPVDDAI